MSERPKSDPRPPAPGSRGTQSLDVVPPNLGDEGGSSSPFNGGGTYDAVLLLARAIDDAGATRRAIRAYLAGVGHGRAAFEGVTGAIAFDSSGDVPAKSVVIGVVRTGRLVAQAEQ